MIFKIQWSIFQVTLEIIERPIIDRPLEVQKHVAFLARHLRRFPEAYASLDTNRYANFRKERKLQYFALYRVQFLINLL